MPEHLRGCVVGGAHSSPDECTVMAAPVNTEAMRPGEPVVEDVIVPVTVWRRPDEPLPEPVVEDVAVIVTVEGVRLPIRQVGEHGEWIIDVAGAVPYRDTRRPNMERWHPDRQTAVAAAVKIGRQLAAARRLHDLATETAVRALSDYYDRPRA